MSSRSDETQRVDLEGFLARPVRVLTFTWNESDAIGTTHTLDPWNAFFTNTYVQNKLNNFAFIQCKLKTRVLINASPFYYGAMYVGYQPLPAITTTTIVGSAPQTFIPLSQRPMAWLNPQHNQGCDLELPFFYHANWLNAQSAGDMTNMGQLSFTNFTTLQSANGVSASGVTVSVYCWAEDVALSGPSVGLATQSKDEYGGDGPVSSVASAVAGVASRLKSLPLIGRFATATEIGATAIASIAKMFGFSNVPVIAPTQPVRSEPFPKLASTEIGFPIEKLTVDSKNELTIDPSAIGLNTDDELNIAALAMRDSMLTTATWSTSAAVDTILFSSAVTPQLFDMTTSTDTSLYYFTPMAWLANMFAQWRGDIIFKFKIVASDYHKGRLRFSFDPTGSTGTNLYGVAASHNIIFNEILDLAETNEVEFRVPYQQAFPFLSTQALASVGTNWSTSSSPTYNSGTSVFNGHVTLRVATALTAPVASSSVSILVLVRAAENIEFASPGELPALTTWQVQSAEVEQAIAGSGIPATFSERNRVVMGETISNLRPLLRRYSLVSGEYFSANSSSYFYLLKKLMTKIPPSYGYDPNGQQSAFSLLSPSFAHTFNFTTPHPLPYIMQAFIAYRGSVNWTFNCDDSVPHAHLRVVRLPQTAGSILSFGPAAAVGGGATISSIGQAAANLSTGAGGSALVAQRTTMGMNVALPMVAHTRFQSTSARTATLPNTSDGSSSDIFSVEVACDTVSTPIGGGLFWSYAGIGTDFGLHFFLNVPVYSLYTSPVLPN